MGNLVKKFNEVLGAFTFALPVVALILVFVLNIRGIGVTPDSIAYISLRDSILSRRGYYGLTSAGEYLLRTHFPPLFPLLLIIFREPTGIILLQALSALASTLLIGKLIQKVWGNNLLVLLGQILFISSPIFFYIHSHIWTEPLFMAGMLFILYRVVVSNTNLSKNHWLITTLFVGLLPLLRYAGLFLIPAYLLIYFIEHFNKREFTKFVKQLLAHSVICFLPFLAWNIFGKLLGASPARQVGSFLFSSEDFYSFISVIWRMLFSAYAFNHYLRIIGIVGVAITWLILNFRRFRGEKLALIKYLYANRVKYWLISLGGLYVIFIVLSMLFFDDAIHMNMRILSVLLPIIIFVIVDILSFVNAKILKVGAIVVVLLSIVGGYVYLKNTLLFGPENSRYQAESSGTLAYVCDSNEIKGKRISSNGFEYLYYYCGIVAGDKLEEQLKKSENLSEYDYAIWFGLNKYSLLKDQSFEIVFSGDDGVVYKKIK